MGMGMETNLGVISVEQVEERWQYMNRGIGGKLGLDPDPLHIDVQKIMSKPDAIRKAGIVQGLQDLGYLPELPATAYASGFTDSQIWLALTHWKADTRNLLATYRYTSAVDFSNDRKRTIQTRELDLTDPLPILLKQTSFDGELQLYRMPAADEPSSLLSRILLFRLKTFNRFEASVDASISQDSLETFRRLKVEFGFSEGDGDIAFLNHLGNASKLSRRFCKKYKERVFVYSDLSVHANNRITGAYYLKWGRPSRVVRRRRGGRMRKVLVQDRAEKPMLHYRSKASNPATLTTLYNTEINTLGLELLQLRLWQHGFYIGAIDADWGILSQKALDEFFASCEAFETDMKQIRDIADGGYVLNLIYILNNLLPASEKTVAAIKQENLHQIVEEIFPENNDDPDWSALQSRAEETLEADRLTFIALPVTTRRRGAEKGSFMKTYRRQRTNFNWFGIKAAIGGVFRKFKEKAGNIIEAVSEAAKKVKQFILKGVRSIQAVFRFALSKIKLVIRIATAALNRFYYWVAGIPFGIVDSASRSFIVSRWSMDFDTVNICSKACPSTIIERHLKRIRFMNMSFHYMISIALVVLEILIGVVTQNWLKVAHSIYKAVVKQKLWNTEKDPYYEYLQAAS